MLNELKIAELYGLYTYTIQFTEKKNPFIITAPNGFGKTTVLRIIHNLYMGNMWYYYYLPFKSIEMVFEGNLSILINKTRIADLGDTPENYSTSVKLIKNNEALEEFVVDINYIKYLRRSIAPIRMRLESKSKEDEYISLNYDLGSDEYIHEKAPELLDFISELKCLMINEQRLIENEVGRNNPIPYKTVDEIKDELKKYLQEARNTYNKISQEVDTTFLERLSHKDGLKQYKGFNNNKLLEEVKHTVELYKKYGLIDNLKIVDKIGVEYQEVLRLYLLDMQKKLKSIKTFYEKLELFDSLVSGKQLSYKHLLFSGDGLTIESSVGDNIPFHKLSSGEQNLMVLCYKLVFELKNDQLLLIDEPENSLHMAWLETLLADYKRVAKITGCRMIIATHSPAFIHGNWNLTYDLCEHGTVIQ